MRVIFSNQAPLATQLDQQLQNNTDTVLDLSENKLGKTPVQELVTMIKVLEKESNKEITTLNLSKTGIQLLNAEDIVTLINALSSTSVKNLIFADNWLAIKKSINELKNIFSTIINTHVITEIDLSGNSLGSINPESFKDVLEPLKGLQAVHLDSNNLQKLGGAHVVAKLIYQTLGDKAVFDPQDVFTREMKDYYDKIVQGAKGVILSTSPYQFYQSYKPGEGKETDTYGDSNDIRPL